MAFVSLVNKILDPIHSLWQQADSMQLLKVMPNLVSCEALDKQKHFFLKLEVIRITLVHRDKRYNVRIHLTHEESIYIKKF